MFAANGGTTVAATNFSDCKAQCKALTSCVIFSFWKAALQCILYGSVSGDLQTGRSDFHLGVLVLNCKYYTPCNGAFASKQISRWSSFTGVPERSETKFFIHVLKDS